MRLLPFLPAIALWACSVRAKNEHTKNRWLRLALAAALIAGVDW